MNLALIRAISYRRLPFDRRQPFRNVYTRLADWNGIKYVYDKQHD